MTLILAALTDEYVALASDRRMTVRRGNRIIRQEDTDTKTFSICGHFMMGFTGLARIDGHRMERWVVEVLSGVPEADYFTVLTDEITAAFRRLGHTGRIPHAFLAVGFARDRQTTDLRPLNIIISNSLDSKGNFSVNSLGDKFRFKAEPLGNRRQLVRSVGWPVADDTASTLDYRIRVAARGEPLNPALTVAPLVLAIRDTASASRDSVGESVVYKPAQKVCACTLCYCWASQYERGPFSNFSPPERKASAKGGYICSRTNMSQHDDDWYCGKHRGSNWPRRGLLS